MTRRQYKRGLILLRQLMSNMLARTKWLDEFLGFMIHELLAVLLCPMVTFFIALVVGRTAFDLSASLYTLLFRSLLSPFYWGAAVLIGFWFNRRMWHHSACWVWVLPVLALGFLVKQDVVPKIDYEGFAKAWEFEYQQFLTCHDECYAAWFLMVPTLNCIAYSIGARLALRSPQSRAARSTTD